MDSSRSVRINGFRKSKEFIKNVVRRFKISSEGTHVGLIRFSTQATKIFGFEEYFSQSEVEDAIDKMTYRRGGTNTEKALNMARNDLFLEKPEGTSRPNIPRFVVLLTDGMSVDPKVTIKEAELLKQKGVFITVVAVGRSVNKRELINIASSPRNVINVASFAYLKKIVLVTKQKVCEGKEAAREVLVALSNPSLGAHFRYAITVEKNEGDNKTRSPTPWSTLWST